jgi:EAL domain-containing protein (putative c-di-GMP-specific phosphodiesterase class I)/CheY-like chemotaxis protein
MSHALVFDDESEIRSLIGGIAEECGFEIDLAATPEEFIERLSSRPALVVLDLVFPGGDGIEMLRHLEAQNFKGAVILVSGMDERVLSTARRLGAALGLNVIGAATKPFKIASLRELLAAAHANNPGFSLPDFRRAITDSELVLYFQPVIDIASKQVTGAEALVRWAHPSRGLIFPDDFLPDMAREGLMADLTWWVVEAALRTSVAWLEDGIDLRISVNVPSSVLSTASFRSSLLEAINRVSPARPRLMIELTETEAMHDPVRIMEVLAQLRLAGIELAIDDFGTGYSSLVELRRLPVNHVKIDKSFVFACTAEADAAAIVRAVIDLSHALGVKVIAEGVETTETLKKLVEWGCEAAQGYLISRAMPGADLPPWLAAFQSP